jgi:hypothetical protein
MSVDGENEQLIEVLLGCVHNITNENDALKKAFSDKNVFFYLKDLLKLFKNESTDVSSSKLNIFKYYLSIIENLLEIEEFKEKVENETFVFEFYSSLSKKFILSINDYYEEFFQFLELINTLSRINLIDHQLTPIFNFHLNLEDAKKQLCKTTFFENLISIIEIEDADKEFVKLCGLFITTLLTDGNVLRSCFFLIHFFIRDLDEDVNEVFEYKNRFILTKAVEWLNADQFKLYLISSVIIANYTRSGKFS